MRFERKFEHISGLNPSRAAGFVSSMQNIEVHGTMRILLAAQRNFISFVVSGADRGCGLVQVCAGLCALGECLRRPNVV